jgi:hypothetical protein
VKRPRLVRSADHAIWLACRFLDKLVSEGRNGCYPAAFAHYDGLSKLEAQLALRMCVEIGFAVRRSDGRYFKRTRTPE